MVFYPVNGARPLDQWRGELDRHFSSFFDSWPSFSQRTRQVQAFPAVNVWEENEELFLEAELPGIKSDQLSISVVGNELTLAGERGAAEQEGTSFHRRERANGSFTRVMRLPYPVDSERVQASLKDGVLLLALPKHEAAKPRKIQVNTGS